MYVLRNVLGVTLIMVAGGIEGRYGAIHHTFVSPPTLIAAIVLAFTGRTVIGKGQ